MPDVLQRWHIRQYSAIFCTVLRYSLVIQGRLELICAQSLPTGHRINGPWYTTWNYGYSIGTPAQNGFVEIVKGHFHDE